MPFKSAFKSIPRPRIRRATDEPQAGKGLPRKRRIRRIKTFRRSTLNPNPGEQPIVALRVQVLSCRDLIGKDRNGSSDPFVTLSILRTRHSTPSIKRTLQPVYKDAIFDFPIYLSLAASLGVLELVVWDRDVLIRKEYLGEVAFPVENWFGDGDSRRPFSWEEVLERASRGENMDISLPLVSTRSNTSSQGSVQIRLGFVPPPGGRETDFESVYGELVKRSRPSLVSSAPTHGVGTIRSRSDRPDLNYDFDFADEGGILSDSDSESSSSSEESDDENDSEFQTEGETELDGEDFITPRPSLSVGEDLLTPRGSLSFASPPHLNLTPASPSESPTQSSFSAFGALLTRTPSAPLPSLSKTPPSSSETSPYPPTSRTLSALPTSQPPSSFTSTADPMAPIPSLSAPLPIQAPRPTQLSSARRLSGILLPRLPKVLGRRSRSISQPVSAPSSPAPPTPPFVPSEASTPEHERVIDLSVDIDVANTPVKKGKGWRSTPNTPAGVISPPSLANGALSTVSFGLGGSGGSTAGTNTDESVAGGKKKKRFRKSWGTRRGKNSNDGEINTRVHPQRSASEPGSATTSSGAEDKEEESVDVADVSRSLKQNEKKTKTKRRRTRRKEREYKFTGENDIVGIVMLEVQRANDLPKLKNMTRTGWDMDPFVVISFSQKIFRTRVIRHSLNPVWDEKLLFQVRRYEVDRGYKLRLKVLDWDKLTSNDFVGDVEVDIHELMEGSGTVDPNTGLYSLREEEDVQEKQYTLPLMTEKGVPWEGFKPTIKFRARYQPYALLRQKFWYQYLKQYDTDDTLRISHLELTSMLDSLGSTLTNETVNSFWTRFGKDSKKDELTIMEAIQCLETELGRPDEEKRKVDVNSSAGVVEGNASSSMSGSASGAYTPLLRAEDRRGQELRLEELDFSGPPLSPGNEREWEDNLLADIFETERSQLPLSAVAVGTSSEDEEEDMDVVETGGLSGYSSGSVSNSEALNLRQSSSGAPSTSGASVTFTTPAVPPPATKKPRFRRGIPRRKARKATNAPDVDAPVERVINVKNCPLCHRPRLSSKAEVDIITHLAVCASQDWSNNVGRIVVGNFVTASQAQRKWYTKVLGKVSSGQYRIGANSANIIVQNRVTGQLEEEKMQVYVRLGIRLLYKGMKGRMEGGRARRLLKSLSVKQGKKYDSPGSVKDIPPFIAFHRLNLGEVAEPLESFKTFNQFFYRKLKPDARPLEDPQNPYRLVSCADCRMMGFKTVDDATRLWIKGREFTIARLLGPSYGPEEAERFKGGALAIFRLAPQDYHRFHSPVDGKIGRMEYVEGEYYTVNPQAIRTALDVFGENARKIIPIDSPQFGRVMAVCVGAMMVGTIKTTVEEGQSVKRGDELGYFAFGGSTLVVLFEPGVVEWDEDLLINGKASLETLVRVGMGVGRSLKRPPTTSKQSPSV